MANEHKHGDMDIRTQEKTFEGFVKASTYTAVGVFIFLILLAMINA